MFRKMSASMRQMKIMIRKRIMKIMIRKRIVKIMIQKRVVKTILIIQSLMRKKIQMIMMIQFINLKMNYNDYMCCFIISVAFTILYLFFTCRL